MYKLGVQKVDFGPLGRAGVRADDEEEHCGLDRSQHGESSYLDLQALV